MTRTAPAGAMSSPAPPTGPSPARSPTPPRPRRTAGSFVVDLWESEEAFRQFGEFIIPVLRELGAPEAEAEPRIYPVHTVVTRPA